MSVDVCRDSPLATQFWSVIDQRENERERARERERACLGDPLPPSPSPSFRQLAFLRKCFLNKENYINVNVYD
uniref:Uncharacterized protein n=1 Tax=Anguilla anguilla TaxID=7936 RepID=A0A0E9WT80_ANGAN